MSKIIPKSALISVSNKDGVVAFARELHQLGITIISTGGTAKTLTDQGIEVTLVSELTGQEEIMSGRVKTLHPKIHGGILGRRDQDQQQAKTHGIAWIDLIVINLYPFAEVCRQSTDDDNIIENVDIGGPAMIRAGAKNHKWVTVATEQQHYQPILDAIKTGGISFELRRQLAAEAFAITANYDALIAGFLQTENLPKRLPLALVKQNDLRYGENPQQQAALYRQLEPRPKANLLNAEQLQGKELSYNNYADAQAALSAVAKWPEPACVIVKHTQPCAVAAADTIDQAFTWAWQADSKSAFGSVVALNRPCTDKIAKFLASVFVEVVIAPSFSPKAQQLLATKANLRLLSLDMANLQAPSLHYQTLTGGLLVQQPTTTQANRSSWQVVTQAKPSAEQLQALTFAWQVVGHIKSNAVLLAQNTVTVGIGGGQVSRVDAVQHAIAKAGALANGSVAASDAFFPFADSIELLAQAGVKAIVQPGGSIKDQQVIDCCNDHGISMVFTGQRCFLH